MQSFGEFDLIAAIRRRAGSHPNVPLGIGDDAALVTGGGSTLVAADLLLEGRHFTVPPEASARLAAAALVGRKALAVNLSDVAAMAGRPVAAFVSVAHHRAYGPAFAERLHAGLADTADEFGVAVAGGDTTVWDGPVVVNVTLLGEVAGGRAVTRGGAKPGDRVFVTGPLGGSLPTGRHLTFPPRVSEALALHAAVELRAMIDISDGLAADLAHVAAESGVAIVLHADKVPRTAAALADPDPLARALTDGEDFELAFAVSAADAGRLRSAPPPGVSVFEVGEVGAAPHGPAVTILDAAGRAIALPERGWVHRW